jgi:hypothetical protein
MVKISAIIPHLKQQQLKRIMAVAFRLQTLGGDNKSHGFHEV